MRIKLQIQGSMVARTNEPMLKCTEKETQLRENKASNTRYHGRWDKRIYAEMYRGDYYVGVKLHILYGSRYSSTS